MKNIFIILLALGCVANLYIASVSEKPSVIHDYRMYVRDADKVTILSCIDEMDQEEVSAKAKSGLTGLTFASFMAGGDITLVNAYLAKMTNAAINSADLTGQTALHWVAYFGNIEPTVVVALLNAMDIEAINAVDNSQETALYVALENRNYEIAKLINDYITPHHLEHRKGFPTNLFSRNVFE